MNIQRSPGCAFGLAAPAQVGTPMTANPQHKIGGKMALEPSLVEILNDPIVHLVMARDGLTPKDVWPQLLAARARLRLGQY